ncbi:MAG: aminotransferase class V-fold PLP-dependent enzyme [Planctomyces sp.]|nr:aminotransferase class V-fold PLP-dependent enzyme [Planctomyces sp.]
MSRQIYLDYNASTPLDPEVVEAMRPFLNMAYGNPSSLHWAGSPARDVVRQLRGEFEERLRDEFGDRVVLNGHPVDRLPNTLNVSFLDHDGVGLSRRNGNDQSCACCDGSVP